MNFDDVPWTDLEALRVLGQSREFDPHPQLLAHSRFPLVRLLNERILSLDPWDYMAALRISRVHLYWARNASSHELADHHTQQRFVWLSEALLRNPEPGHRQMIERALGGSRRSDSADARAREAIKGIAMATLPRELIRLSRSLRQQEPRLPHLACVASHRAVAYADRGSGDLSDPAVAIERYSARSSLVASLRATKRQRDAVAVADETMRLRPDHPVGWTVLIAATRDLHGPSAAVEVVQRALEAVGPDAAARDAKFARAAAAAYEHAGLPVEAAAWFRATIESEDVSGSSRQEARARAYALVDVLRERQQHEEADQLEALLLAADRAA